VSARVSPHRRTQRAGLPDQVDPKPIGEGINVYFTRLRVGGVDFGIHSVFSTPHYVEEENP